MAGMPYLNDLVEFSSAYFCHRDRWVRRRTLFTDSGISHIDVRGDGLAEGGRGSAGKVWRRIGSKLVILELTTAMVLLVGAGLLGKSFYRLLQVRAGFEPKHLIIMTVAAPGVYMQDKESVALARKVVEQVKSLPGVTSVALASTLPLGFNGNTDWIRIVGRAYNGEHNEVNEREVSSDYFATLQAKLLAGRTFTDSEDLSKPSVVVINKTLANKYFPGEDPIGQRFGDTNLKSIKEIVGVVDDIREGRWIPKFGQHITLR